MTSRPCSASRRARLLPTLAAGAVALATILIAPSSATADQVAPAYTKVTVVPAASEVQIGGSLPIEVTVANLSGSQTPFGTYVLTVAGQEFDSRTTGSGRALLDLGGYLESAARPGVTQVTVSFFGDGYARSAASFDVTIKPAQTQLALSLSPAVVAHGNTPRATVSVTPAVSSRSTPDGRVTLRHGGEVLGSAQLQRVEGTTTGRAGFALDSPALTTIGDHQLTATYEPGVRFVAAGDVSETLTVTKRPSGVTASHRVSSSRSVRATVRLRSGRILPTGTVRVREGRKVLGTGTVTTARRGQVSLRLPRLRKGKHRLTVVYAGSPTVAGSTSTRTIRVR